MKQVRLEKCNKKSCIVSLGTRITLNGRNVRTVDIIYLRDYMINVLNRQCCDLISYRTKYEDELPDYFKDVREINVNDYDEMIIYNATPNAFGGIFKGEAIEIYKKMYNFDGELWYFFCEQKAPPIDFSRVIKYKHEHYGECKNTWNVPVDLDFHDKWREKVYKKMKVMFVGDDYDKYVDIYFSSRNKSKGKVSDYGVWDLNMDNEWAILPLNDYYSEKEMYEEKTKDYPLSYKEYDLVYFGNNRSGKRNKIITCLYDHEELKTYFIGYETKFKHSTPTEIAYITHDKLFGELSKSWATVVMCEDTHNGNIRTPRFFESMLIDMVAFIWYEYDPDKKFIDNKELQDFIYIKSYDELKEKLDKIKNDEEFYRYIIKLERESVKKYYEQSIKMYE